MAVKSQALTVTTTRQAITIPVDNKIAGCVLWLYGEYHGSSSKVAIGGDDVTVDNGIHLYAGEKIGPISLQNGETLYAITDDAEGLNLRVMATGA